MGRPFADAVSPRAAFTLPAAVGYLGLWPGMDTAAFFKRGVLVPCPAQPRLFVLTKFLDGLALFSLAAATFVDSRPAPSPRGRPSWDIVFTCGFRVSSISSCSAWQAVGVSGLLDHLVLAWSPDVPLRNPAGAATGPFAIWRMRTSSGPGPSVRPDPGDVGQLLVSGTR